MKYARSHAVKSYSLVACVLVLFQDCQELCWRCGPRAAETGFFPLSGSPTPALVSSEYGLSDFFGFPLTLRYKKNQDTHLMRFDCIRCRSSSELGVISRQPPSLRRLRVWTQRCCTTCTIILRRSVQCIQGYSLYSY